MNGLHIFAGLVHFKFKIGQINDHAQTGEVGVVVVDASIIQTKQSDMVRSNQSISYVAYSNYMTVQLLFQSGLQSPNT